MRPASKSIRPVTRSAAPRPARNVISGNTNVGVFLGTDAPANLLEGNAIGTSTDETAALANVFGVSINAPGNTMGDIHRVRAT